VSEEEGGSADGSGELVSADPLAIVRRQLRDQLRRRVDARRLSTAPRTERRVRVREEALDLLRASGAILPQRELTRMVNEASDEVVGFGPIEFLLKDPDVTRGHGRGMTYFTIR
jgi:pilus assembly protein CpaF